MRETAKTDYSAWEMRNKLLGELFSLDVFIVISPGTTLIIQIS